MGGALTLVSGVASGPAALPIAGIFTLVMAWGLMALVWALVVDRTSLHGAVDRPEESVESRWLDSAMSGACRDTITVTGLALATIAITGVHVDVVFALAGVVTVALFSTCVRYLVAQKLG